MNHLLNIKASPVISLSLGYEVFDLSKGYNPKKITEFIKKGGRAVGGYNEKRSNMYLASHFQNTRNVHMGIDFWAPAGEPVFAALNGEVAYAGNHAAEGNYGATIVLKHEIGNSGFYALYGHLSLKSLEVSIPGKKVLTGETIGWLGAPAENGNWPPHLHYQLSWKDPGQADMPGVVSLENREEAVRTYPDPRKLLGEIY
jgi:murein DD-endopeptidase MepM/ murein hydrolase activator NlpD